MIKQMLPLLKNLATRYKQILAGFLALSLTSCGYRTASEDKTTISVPYVEGDNQGQLTAEIIRQLTNSDMYDFVRKDGDLVLIVSLVGDRNDHVGFKYDRTEKKGKIEHNLMSTENRRILTAQVTLSRPDTEEVVLGPMTITATGDYDYIDVNTLKELAFRDQQGKRKKTINFSLGQLDSVEGAQDAVLTPIYRQLAQKIAAVLQRRALVVASEKQETPSEPAGQAEDSSTMPSDG